MSLLLPRGALCSPLRARPGARPPGRPVRLGTGSTTVVIRGDVLGQPVLPYLLFLETISRRTALRAARLPVCCSSLRRPPRAPARPRPGFSPRSPCCLLRPPSRSRLPPILPPLPPAKDLQMDVPMRQPSALADRKRRAAGSPSAGGVGSNSSASGSRPASPTKRPRTAPPVAAGSDDEDEAQDALTPIIEVRRLQLTLVGRKREGRRERRLQQAGGSRAASWSGRPAKASFAARHSVLEGGSCQSVMWHDGLDGPAA